MQDGLHFLVHMALLLENLFNTCKQQRCRPAYTPMQSNQCLCYHFLESIIARLGKCKIPLFQLISAGCVQPYMTKTGSSVM